MAKEKESLKDLTINALTALVIIIIFVIPMAALIGLAWRFILKPLFVGGC
jgi:Tfp pilus assembly protein PilO